jgi:acyl carrier protein
MVFAMLAFSMPLASANDESMVYNNTDISRLASRELAIATRLRQLLDQEFGVPRDRILGESNLIKDFGMDRLDVYELVAMLCGEFKVALPEHFELLKVEHIVAYVANTPPGPPVPTKSLEKLGPVYTQKVFFATNRQPQHSGDLSTYFGDERTEGSELYYGVSDVSIPIDIHRPGKLESASVLTADPRKHIVLSKVEVFGNKHQFFKRIIQDHTNGDIEGGDQVLLFIHGYNFTFSKAMRRTAQIAYDFGFTGRAMAYTWPSKGRLTGYFSDRRTVRASAPLIAKVLRQLIQNIGASKIHLIAHSLGSEGLLGALELLNRDPARQDGQKFANVILAAPDFDSELFQSAIAGRILPLTERLTLYTSDEDTALTASGFFRLSKRLGTPMSVFPGVQTVDVKASSVTPWGLPYFHAYYAGKKRVIDDIAAVLRGIAPSARSLIERAFEGLPYWEISDASS